MGVYDNYCSPVQGEYRITSEYGWRRDPLKRDGPNKAKFHSGIDLAGKPAGTPLYAIEDGVVVKIRRAEYLDDEKAESITIRHDNGVITYSFYTHLYPFSTNHLETGSVVNKGDEIGKLGNTGGSTGAHLHFEIRDLTTNRIDPINFLRATSQEITTPEYGSSLELEDKSGKKRTVKPILRRERRSGNYIIKNEQGEQVSAQPPPARDLGFQPIMRPDTDPDKAAADTDVNGTNGEIISDEQIKNGLIATFLPEILEKKRQEGLRPKNLLYIKGSENTPFLKNLIFSKAARKTDFSTLTNLEISSMVPFVEMYAVKKVTDINAKTNIHQEILFPFDDYTNKAKIETIFYDKTTRGGNINIKSVDFKSLATNPSNKKMVSVTVDIFIQDIQEIESIRNGISLLDFLYPAGTADPDTYDPKSFNIKLKLGWLFKEDALPQIKEKIDLSDLAESIYVTLYKHTFSFDEQGSVILKLEYHGMIETEMSNENEYNVLDKLSPSQKARERNVDIWESTLKALEDIKNSKFSEDSIQRLVNNRVVSKLLSFKNEKTKSVARSLAQVYQEAAGVVNGGVAYIAGRVARTTQEEIVEEAKETLKGVLYGNWFTEGTVLTLKINNLPDQSEAKEFVISKNGEKEEGNIEEAIETLKKAIDTSKKDLKYSYSSGLSNLLSSFVEKKQVRYLSINEQQKIELANLANISNTVTEQQLSDINNSVKNLNKQAKQGTVAIPEGKIDEATNLTNEDVKKEVGDKFHVNADVAIDQILSISDEVNQSFNKQIVSNIVGNRNIADIKGEEALKIIEERDRVASLERKEKISFYQEYLLNQKIIIVPYVFLEDIISYFVELFYGNGKEIADLKEMRVALGSFSYSQIGDFLLDGQKTSSLSKSGVAKKNRNVFKNEATGLVEYRKFSKKYANIGEIPVSLHSLINWYNTHILDSSLQKMSFISFIQSMFNNLVPANMTNGLFQFIPSRKILPTFSFTTLPHNFTNNGSQSETYIKNNSYELPFDKEKFKNNPFFQMKNAIGKEENETFKTEEKVNYMFIFSANEKGVELNGETEKDLERKIYHFYIGEETGLVKSLKFSREDNAKLDAANINNANNGDFDRTIIRQIYNLDLEMFGNTIFEPGQLLHVVPTYPGSRLKNLTLYKIGLGGYYIITKTDSFIEDGKFETKIHAKWQASGLGIEKEQNYDIIKVILDAPDTPEQIAGNIAEQPAE